MLVLGLNAFDINAFVSSARAKVVGTWEFPGRQKNDHVLMPAKATDISDLLLIVSDFPSSKEHRPPWQEKGQTHQMMSWRTGRCQIIEMSFSLPLFSLFFSCYHLFMFHKSTRSWVGISKHFFAAINSGLLVAVIIKNSWEQWHPPSEP